MLLADLAKQLEIGVFPTCKIMHVNPKAVKRMMDDQFRKAYGLEVEEEMFELAQARRMVPVRHASTVDVGDVASARESIADGDHSETTVAAASSVEPAKKTIKTTQPSAAHKVVTDGTAVADAIARMLSDVGNHSKNAVEALSPAQPEKKKIALSQPNKAQSSLRPISPSPVQVLGGLVCSESILNLTSKSRHVISRRTKRPNRFN
jgi:hypothetical protein